MPFRKSRTLAFVISSIAAYGAPALAQDAPALEEVLVTATKREQSLQEIPLSVTAVTGEKLDETGTKNLADLTTLVPNIHFTQTGLSTQMRIRGIGSDNSQGFEQSVGVYVDGIFHGRAQLFRAPMFDMERVEVMRGPQSTLFGKNSIAGALDLITARPTDELSGSLTGSYEAEFGTTELTSVVSGPLTENLRGRIALRKYDDPGYYENTTKGTDEPEQDITSGRLSLEWDAADDITLRYTGELNEFDVVGRPVEITQDVAGPSGFNYGQSLAAIGREGFEAEQDYRRETDAPEFSDNKTSLHVLNIDWDLNGYTLTSLTGAVAYDYTENCDCDFVPTNIFDLALEEDYQQTSQEFRIASPEGKSVDWLGGVFFQKYDQNFYDLLRVSDQSLLVPSIYQSTYEPLYAGAIAQGAPPAQADAFAAPRAGQVAADFANSGVSRQFNQQSNTQAIFGQATWNISDSFRMIVGGRYTSETKRGQKELHVVNLETGEYQPTNLDLVTQTPALPSAPQIYASDSFRVDTEEGTGHKVNKVRSESAFTPLLIAQWDINDNNSTYISWTKGFKAGGFDPRSNRVDAFEFDEEKAKAFELGYKTAFWSNRGEVNLALFRTDYEDLQVSQFDGAVGFNVGNAKDTRVQGLELDGRVALTSHLLATYGVALLDFEYQDFKNGNCHYGQTGVDNNGDGVNECDYTGKSGVYTPDYTVNLSLDYRRNVGNSLEFAAILDGQFVDGYQVHVNLDPAGEIDAYTMLGLRLQIGGEHWHTALLGKNLLDESVVTASANAPLSENNFGANTFYSFVNRPRTVAMEVAFKF
ncbi:MAG TPA: TonB-dependent receptor [Marinagarivorans sp.]